jgi:hypothetical protein
MVPRECKPATEHACIYQFIDATPLHLPFCFRQIVGEVTGAMDDGEESPPLGMEDDEENLPPTIDVNEEKLLAAMEDGEEKLSTAMEDGEC